MFGRIWCVGCLLFFAVLLAVPSDAAGTDSRPRSVLEGVAALDKPVTYTETKIPLGELVQKVAADTGIQLAAAPGVGDEPVAVIVKQFPARELLEQLAELLDYRWSRHGTEGAWRYEIWQDLASKQREEVLRQAAFAAAEKQFREALERTVEMAALPPEQIQRMLEEEEKREREWAKLPPEQERAIRDSPEEWERIRRISPAGYLWSPIGRALANLLGHLTPQQWVLLRQDEPLILSTDPKPGELPLPAETARAFRSSPLHFYPPWLSPVLPNQKHAESVREEEKKRQEQWAGASGYQVAMDLEKLQLTMSATPLHDGTPIRDFFGGGGSYLQVIAGPSPPALPRSAAENAPGRQAALQRDPLLGARKPFSPEAKPLPDLWSRRPGATWALRDLLPDLARTYGVHFISDAYYWGSRPIDAGRFSASEPTALYALLDRLVGVSYRWDCRGKLIRLRSRTWFSERPREIPLRLIHRWKALCDQDGVLPLPEQLTMLATLTEDQWTTVDLFLATLGETEATTRGTFMDNQIGLPPAFVGSREGLRLLAALTPAQQQALWNGRTIAVAQMSPAQRDLFMAPFRQRQERLIEGRQTPWQPPGGNTGSLSLTLEPLLLFRQQRGRLTIYRTEPAPPRGRTPAALRTSGSTPVPPRPATPAPSPSSVQSYPVTRAELDFQYGPGYRESQSITIPSPP